MSQIFSAVPAAAGMAELYTTGNNPSDTPEMRRALLARGYQMAGPSTLASGISGGDMSDSVAKKYYARQADEDTTQFQKKMQMVKKRKAPGLTDKGEVEQVTPNDLVQESFRDVRNPRSLF